MTADEVMVGVGLVVVLAVGSQLLASRLRVPALLILHRRRGDLAPGELLAAASGAGAELEGITGVLLLTEEDDFNALTAMPLRDSVEGPVHRLAPAADSQGVVAPYTGGEPLFRTGLTGPELARRYEAGARVLTRRADGAVPAGHDVLFVVRADGRLAPVTHTQTPDIRPGDTAVLLGPPSRQPSL
ncbi:hypothetical protein [Streptomyces sp. NPDC058240]|uniref:hypothetical protein n=1 Tax=Streptomyces sp. NPDC058240 TaxID=3346396 RepID=UPI0036F14D78